MELGWAVVAFTGTSVYFTSFMLFQTAARRMPPLRGSRPVHATLAMLSDPIWFGGGLLLFVGLACQIAAFTALPAGIAQPILGLSLLILLAYTTLVLRERLSRREWAVVLLAVVAVTALGLSGSSDVEDLSTDHAWSVPHLVLAGVPPVFVAGLVWLFGDQRTGGRHAQPLSGVAYGVSAGMCAGSAEAGARGVSALWSDTSSVAAVVSSPYPLLILGMAGLTLIQLQIALQRCRMITVAVLIALSGRVTMTLTSTLLYDEPWPSDPTHLVLRYGAYTLAVALVLAFPSHEPTPTPSAAWRRRTAPTSR
ncbi:hypothetical protein GCM10022221_28060 [Actinocorallia aurea]